MPKITHISTSRLVNCKTKNGGIIKKNIIECIIDGHQVDIRRPEGKTVKVGDEIGIIKSQNEKGITVWKEKSKEENNSDRIIALENGQKDIWKKIEELSSQLRGRVEENKEKIQDFISSSMDEVNKIEEKAEVIPSAEVEPELPRMEDVDLLKHDDKLKEIRTYEEFKSRIHQYKANTVMFDKFYTRWLSFHKDTDEDCLPF